MTTALALLLALPAMASDRTDISIRRGDGKTVAFKVELATDGESRMKGLMFRKKLAASRGMLFLYDEPDYRAFWMKDTLIPLDMLFFTAKGDLVYIHANAKPKSLDAIAPKRNDICAILEIGGGEAERLGLKTGDKLDLKDSSACLP